MYQISTARRDVEVRKGQIGKEADAAEQSINEYRSGVVEDFGGERQEDGKPAGEHNAEGERRRDDALVRGKDDSRPFHASPALEPSERITMAETSAEGGCWQQPLFPMSDQKPLRPRPLHRIIGTDESSNNSRQNRAIDRFVARQARRCCLLAISLASGTPCGDPDQPPGRLWKIKRYRTTSKSS